MAVIPLLAVGASLFFLPDARPGPRTSKGRTTSSIWNQVTTGPYGPRPGIPYETLTVIFRRQYLESNEQVKSQMKYVSSPKDVAERMITLSAVEELYRNHPNINWDASRLKALRKKLQLYKYGYVYKSVSHLVNDIMTLALMGNLEQWHGRDLDLSDLPNYDKSFSYRNYPIAYSEDNLGREPAPSMIDQRRNRYGDYII